MSPRYSLAWSVQVRGHDGACVDAQTSDVSLSGVGLRLSREAVTALAQGGGLLTPGDRLRLVLPPGDARETRNLELDSRVRHVRRLSLEEYQVGLWFSELGPTQEADLQAMLANAAAMRP